VVTSSYAWQIAHPNRLDTPIYALRVPGDQMFSIAEAAAVLGLTPPTLYRLVGKGEIVAKRVARHLRISEAEVRRYLEASRVSPGDLESLYQPLLGGPSGETEQRSDRSWGQD
jgi:excisionase family DNA binding protein